MGQAFDFLAQCQGFAEGGFGFLPERTAADMDALLRQVPDAGPLGCLDGSGIRLERARHAFHESRLARAVVAGEGNALARLDRERQIVEKNPGAKLHAQ